MATQTERFHDWGNTTGTQLELTDNADSISLTVRYRGADSSVQVELDVRIAPEDLDRFQQWVADVRRDRGI